MEQTGVPPTDTADLDVSVKDHKAFAAKHLPDLGYDVKGFRVFTWRLTNWTKLEEKLTSPEFECGGHKWRILLFPFGNSNAPPHETLSVYLDYANPKEAPEGWHACAQFAIAISNIQDPTTHTVSYARHRFVAEEPEWGFTRFSELRKLFSKQEGNTRPTIEEESADLTVYVRVLEDPTGVLLLWHNFTNLIFWPKERRLEEERLQLEEKKREREEQNLSLTVKIVTDATFVKHEGFDLATFDEKNWPPSDLPSFRILKQEIYSVFKARIAQHFDYPESQIRLWVLVNRQNKTVRPDAIIHENEPTLKIEDIRINMAAGQNDLRLYLEVIPDPAKPISPPQSIMIFLKHFNTSNQSLYGISKTYVLRRSRVGDLVPIINQRMRWISGTPLKLYEEIKPGLIQLMKPGLSFIQSEIQDGDIVCFQVDLLEKEVHDLESQSRCSDSMQYYEYLQNRVLIIFKPKFGEPDHRDRPEFKLILSKKQNYDIMAGKVGEYLRHNPIKLRFTTTHASNGSAKSILKQSLNQCIAEIVTPSYIKPCQTTILYEKLEVSIVELETTEVRTGGGMQSSLLLRI
ncbi:ICP0-binding domain of ubiquitin-specific protease 7-domain-containing protein [Amanita rubescens]|nr:ICP0-binding domain of ubiquitin-specific protease 7-domain-containing protein [Amanita rubescens]